MEGKLVEQSRTIMTELVMPNYNNALDNLMGGIMMKWMDTVGAVCAGKHCESNVVTASVDNVSFQKAIPNGDVVTLTATVTRAFKTSIEVYVEVFAANICGGNNRRCNDAYFTFVAIDKDKMKPRQAPPLIPVTPDEIERHAGALRRRQLRLILAGRLKPSEAQELKDLFLKTS